MSNVIDNINLKSTKYDIKDTDARSKLDTLLGTGEGSIDKKIKDTKNDILSKTVQIGGGSNEVFTRDGGYKTIGTDISDQSIVYDYGPFKIHRGITFGKEHIDHYEINSIVANNINLKNIYIKNNSNNTYKYYKITVGNNFTLDNDKYLIPQKNDDLYIFFNLSYVAQEGNVESEYLCYVIRSNEEFSIKIENETKHFDHIILSDNTIISYYILKIQVSNDPKLGIQIIPNSNNLKIYGVYLCERIEKVHYVRSQDNLIHLLDNSFNVENYHHIISPYASSLSAGNNSGFVSIGNDIYSGKLFNCAVHSIIGSQGGVVSISEKTNSTCIGAQGKIVQIGGYNDLTYDNEDDINIGVQGDFVNLFHGTSVINNDVIIGNFGYYDSSYMFVPIKNKYKSTISPSDTFNNFNSQYKLIFGNYSCKNYMKHSTYYNHTIFGYTNFDSYNNNNLEDFSIQTNKSLGISIGGNLNHGDNEILKKKQLLITKNNLYINVSNNVDIKANDINFNVFGNYNFNDETIGTYKFIDMGLSVKWATYNIGATKPEESGWYFQWAGTKAYNSNKTPIEGGNKINFNYNSYCPYYKSGGNNLSKWSKYTAFDRLSSTNIADNRLVLEPEDDAVFVHIGNGCRMPTYEEYDELLNACDVTWMTNYNYSGINGILLTLKTDTSKQLFFPVTGYLNDSSIINNNNRNECYYWTNNLAYQTYSAHCINVYKYSSSLNIRLSYTEDRYVGMPIRPVFPKQKITLSSMLNKIDELEQKVKQLERYHVAMVS